MQMYFPSLPDLGSKVKQDIASHPLDHHYYIDFLFILRKNINDVVQAHSGNETGAEYWISWTMIDNAGAWLGQRMEKRERIGMGLAKIGSDAVDCPSTVKTPSGISCCDPWSFAAAAWQTVRVFPALKKVYLSAVDLWARRHGKKQCVFTSKTSYPLRKTLFLPTAVSHLETIMAIYSFSLSYGYVKQQELGIYTYKKWKWLGWHWSEKPSCLQRVSLFKD